MTAIQGLSDQAWVQQLGWTLVQFLWQGTVIVLLFAAVRRLLRPRVSAHARYVLACGALALMVAAPVCTFLVRVNVPIAPAWPMPSPCSTCVPSAPSPASAGWTWGRCTARRCSTSRPPAGS